MARYEDDNYYERDDGGRRNERFDRERPWNYNEFPDRGRRQEQFGRGRFGERADYEVYEPRYSNSSGRGLERDRYYERDYYQGRREDYAPTRSRLRCRDIMTRDLAVATGDTPLAQIAIMMKDEDTGVIPVVDYEANAGNGGDGGAHLNDRRPGSYSYGKLVGLVTDRDIVIRAVSDNKDCRTTRAEDVMSTDILKSSPNDRVVDVLRKMADKQVRRIPVVTDNGSLRGMISLGDIALETEADRELGEAIEEISRKASFWGRIFS